MKLQAFSRTTPAAFPIPRATMHEGFRVLSRFDGKNLDFLDSDYREHLADSNPIRHLLELHTRPYLASGNVMTDAYKAGVITGSVIVRSRLQHIGISPEAVTVSEQQLAKLATIHQYLTRFTLHQFFAPGGNTLTSLQKEVENPWRDHRVPFAGEQNPPLNNDWTAVGLGDALALYRDSLQSAFGLPEETLAIELLKPENPPLVTLP